MNTYVQRNRDTTGLCNLPSDNSKTKSQYWKYVTVTFLRFWCEMCGTPLDQKPLDHLSALRRRPSKMKCITRLLCLFVSTVRLSLGWDTALSTALKRSKKPSGATCSLLLKKPKHWGRSENKHLGISTIGLVLPWHRDLWQIAPPKSQLPILFHIDFLKTWPESHDLPMQLESNIPRLLNRKSINQPTNRQTSFCPV